MRFVLSISIVFMMLNYSCDRTMQMHEKNIFGNLENGAYHITYIDTMHRGFQNPIDTVVSAYLYLQKLNIEPYIKAQYLFTSPLYIQLTNEQIFLRNKIFIQISSYLLENKMHFDSLMISRSAFYLLFGTTSHDTICFANQYQLLNYSTLQDAFLVDQLSEVFETNHIHRYFIEFGSIGKCKGRNIKNKSWEIPMLYDLNPEYRSLYQVNQSLAFSLDETDSINLTRLPRTFTALEISKTNITNNYIFVSESSSAVIHIFLTEIYLNSSRDIYNISTNQ